MEDNNLVRLEDENGNGYNMLILKEFSLDKKKYAILMEMNECSCGCGDDCECDDDCDCGCHEGKECTCHEEDPMVCVLEISKDKKGNEIFKSIEDEKEYDKVIKKADKVLYE